jgi:hypothetical protein
LVLTNWQNGPEEQTWDIGNIQTGFLSSEDGFVPDLPNVFAKLEQLVNKKYY